jgi:formamidopyrimidine-DNA glycosylase
MPEGPEVALITKQLSKYKGSTIKKIRDTRYKLPRITYPVKIVDVSKKGKFIYITLSNKKYLCFSLGMTGYFTTEVIKHNHLEIDTSRGKLYFNDVRRFGKVYIFTQDELDKKLDTLGPDLEYISKMSQEEFNERLSRFRKNIAEILLDQKFISGVGNYIRSEALYAARIHPMKKVLTPSEKKRLKKALAKVWNAPLKIYQKSSKTIKDSRGRTIWY